MREESESIAPAESGSGRVRIRPAGLGDAHAILECLRLAFEPYRELYTAGAFEDTILTPATLERRLAQMTILVAGNSEGEIMGTIALRVAGDEAHIRGMAVNPKWQGTGVAHALLDHVEASLRASNAARITLDTTAPLRRAIRFYEKRGFKPSGRVADFFGMALAEHVKALR